MMAMSYLYEGKISPDFSPIDEGLSRQWLRRAAEAGHYIARSNLVWKITGEVQALSLAQYKEFKGWMEDVWENAPRGSHVESSAAGNLSWLLMMLSDNEEDKRANLDHVLAWMWAENDDRDQHTAACNYARSFLEGRGCTPNRYLAKVWIDRALAIRPDDPLTQELADRVYLKGELLGASKAALAFRRDRKRVDERAHQLTFGRGEPDFD
jgi:TPR repeat protein